MKRIILMLTVAALMVAALTITSAGAFAAPNCDERTNNKNCVTANPGGQPKGASQTSSFKPGS
jgi:hypothetical protein